MLHVFLLPVELFILIALYKTKSWVDPLRIPGQSGKPALTVPQHELTGLPPSPSVSDASQAGTIQGSPELRNPTRRRVGFALLASGICVALFAAWWYFFAGGSIKGIWAVTNSQLAAANSAVGSSTSPPSATPPAVTEASAEASAVDGACLSYLPDVVKLTGVITEKTFPGKPNFESVERGDEPETSWYLTLTSPACIAEQKIEDHTLQAYADVREMRLVIEDRQTYDKYRPLLGRTVTVTGTLDEAVSMHSHTPVMLSVAHIEQ